MDSITTESISFIPITFHDFLTLSTFSDCCLCLFEASWHGEQKRDDILEHCISIGIDLIYSVTVEIGSNAESFAIDTLRANELPLVTLYTKGHHLRHKEEGRQQDGMIDIWSLGQAWSKVCTEINETRHLLSLPPEDDRRHFEPPSLINPKDLLPYLFQTVAPEDYDETTEPLSLFLSGDRSSVGKSSICLSILASLITLGVDPTAIAYIKPVTQCEAEQPVAQYCAKNGIAHQGIGPIVFYKGFTRAYLKGETDSSESLLSSAVQAVSKIGRGKKLVVVDGVGYPAVGSICNLSNADVARALGCPVVLVGKSGVGDAVDSYNMNARFFEAYGVSVLGGIFNKLPLDGFYSLASCREAVASYFVQHRPGHCPYGFLPLLSSPGVLQMDTEVVTDTSDNSSSSSSSSSSPSSAAVTATAIAAPQAPTPSVPSDDQLAEAFLRYVDIGRLLLDVWMHHVSPAAVWMPSFRIEGNLDSMDLRSSSLPHHLLVHVAHSLLSSPWLAAPVRTLALIRLITSMSFLITFHLDSLQRHKKAVVVTAESLRARRQLSSSSSSPALRGVDSSFLVGLSPAVQSQLSVFLSQLAGGGTSSTAFAGRANSSSSSSSVSGKRSEPLSALNKRPRVDGTDSTQNQPRNPPPPRGFFSMLESMRPKVGGSNGETIGSGKRSREEIESAAVSCGAKGG